MLDLGCRVALGVDGKALDEDDDALRELRLAHLLHAGTGFKAAVGRKQMLQIAFAMACLLSPMSTMVVRLRRECRPTSFYSIGRRSMTTASATILMLWNWHSPVRPPAIYAS
jgi:hypothetical protein